MATIVNLSDYRGARKVEQRDSPAPEAGVKPGPHYFCTRCETDRFKLFSSGVVHCAQCGALMRNITVAETEQGKAGSK
jgi:ribosomal protein L37AE/L43A